MRKKRNEQKNYLSKDEAMNFDETKEEVKIGEVEEEVLQEEKTPLENVHQEETEENAESFEDVFATFKVYSDMETVLRSGLLGYFEGEKYKIRKEVANDLLRLPKIIDEQKIDSITCHAFYNDTNFKFFISYDNFTTYSSARIFLLEEEDKVEETVQHKTLIGECVRPGGNNIAEFLMTEWNLKKKPEDGGEALQLDELDAVLLGIKADYVFNQELIEVLSQIYLLRVSALLGKCGELGEKVLKEYGQILRDFAIKRPVVLQKFSMMKHIFDSVIKKNGANEILKTEHEEEYKEALKSFSEPLKKINSRYLEGKEYAFPSLEKAKKDVEEVKENKKVGKEKSEKPFYIPTPKIKASSPYKYGDIPKMPDFGKGGSSAGEKRIQSKVGKNLGQETQQPDLQEDYAKGKPKMLNKARKNVIEELSKRSLERIQSKLQTVEEIEPNEMDK